MIGYYGDKRWCLWLIDKMHGGGNFRVCGCTETALMFMANHEEHLWIDWAKAHRDETQEEWIRDGFAQRGITVHLPPRPEDAIPLLEILGHRKWNTLREGPQGTNAPTAFPTYLQYNAFRWLRDSGFDQTTFAVSNAPALSSDVVRVGLMQYTKWYAAHPKRDGIGILAFGKSADDDDGFWGTPDMLRFWFQALIWLLAVGPVAVGTAIVFLWDRAQIGDRVKQAAHCVALPFAVAGGWVRKHRRMVLSAGLLAGCLGLVITS